MTPPRASFSTPNPVSTLRAVDCEHCGCRDGDGERARQQLHCRDEGCPCHRADRCVVCGGLNPGDSSHTRCTSTGYEGL